MQDTAQNGDFERLDCFQKVFHSLRWVIWAPVSFILSLMLTKDHFSSSHTGLEMTEIHCFLFIFLYLLLLFLFLVSIRADRYIQRL